MKTKVLFITSDRVKDRYGITSGLFNSATFVVRYLKDAGLDAKLESIPDSNSIDRVVTKFNPDVVIIEALWVPPAKFVELFKIQRHRLRRWIVRIHSKAPFLANEGLATSWIRQYASIQDVKIQIAPNTRELTEQLASAFPYGEFLCLPNIYYPPKYKPTPRVPEKYWINIGSFGAIRPMKNQFQQALAAIEFAEQEGKLLKFHVNATRTEQAGDNALKNLRALFEGSPHELVEHPWYKHAEFLKVANSMDYGMQCSFSESFNIVTADFVTAGTPIVVSDDIEWAPALLKVSPTSHKGMVKRLSRAKRLRRLAVWLQNLALSIYNIKAELAWKRALKID